MKIPPPALVLSFALGFVTPDLARAQELQAEATPPFDRAALEAEFARTMSGARLVGLFTETGTPEGTPPKPDSYTIGKVEKVEGNKWRFEVIIEYSGMSIPIPLLIDVEWAGDTPIITLTDRKIPMFGTFTARVMVFRDQYVGIWMGSDHGGQMYGIVVRAAVPPPKEEDKGGSIHWPSFRGKDARGQAEGFATAAIWDVETGQNVRWKTPIAGLAHSSPVIWGDRIFVTSAVRLEGPAELRVGLYGDIAPVEDEGEQAFITLCLDKATGEILWEEVAWEGLPKFKRHTKGSFAASTPATDGEHVVSFFGTEGLYAYDMDGALLWQKDLGDLDSGYFRIPVAQWGFASSPIIHDGQVIVQCDVMQGAFLAMFDVATGEEVWRTARDDYPTWSTPTVDVREGRSQVLVNGYKHMGGYDLATGAELWRIGGGGDVPVPTPIVAHDLVYLMSAHGRSAPIFAIDALATGELTGDAEAVTWSQNRGANYMQTPIVVGDYLYGCRDNGVLTCFDARTGEKLYSERVSGGGTGFTASSVAADGKLYLTSEEGVIHVMKLGPEFELLAQNDMGEECMATPAISEGVLYWRTRRHLVAIADSASGDE
ncbi:MAG: pyrrolo-quinoline quinone [Planctomycetota bacterium]|nr:MAG: pyrrolo-quinoline quinone [Planctomycetota bacterium]